MAELNCEGLVMRNNSTCTCSTGAFNWYLTRQYNTIKGQNNTTQLAQNRKKESVVVYIYSPVIGVYIWPSV